MRRSSVRRVLAVGCTGLLVATVASACSSSGSNSAGGSSAGGSGGSGSGKITSVKVIEATPALGYAAMYLADTHGFFKQHGLNVDIISAPGGSTAAIAVLAGDAQFASVSTTNAVASTAAGKPLVAFAELLAHLSVPVVASKKLWDSSGLTDSSSLTDKLQLLQGKKLGVISATGQNAQIFNYLFKAHDVDPKGASQNVLKTPDGMLNGLKQGQVDAVNYTIPYPEQMQQQGYGHILINLAAGEDPTLSGMDSDSVVVTPSFLKDHADQVKAFYDALNDADAFLFSNPTEAANEIYKKYFGQMDRATFDLGFQDATKDGTWSKTPAMSQDGMQKLINFMNVAGQKVPDNWNESWTDQFSK